MQCDPVLAVRAQFGIVVPAALQLPRDARFLGTLDGSSQIDELVCPLFFHGASAVISGALVHHVFVREAAASRAYRAVSSHDGKTLLYLYARKCNL